MELYLIRHPEPDIQKGICYGQANLPIREGMLEETVEQVTGIVPTAIPIFSSPLIRCKASAKKFGSFKTDDRLMELNFGDWELKKWDDIPAKELNTWMNDYINQRPTNGESGMELHHRVGDFLADMEGESSIIIGHLGSFRSLYAHVHRVPLTQAFGDFHLGYGDVYVLRSE